MSEYDQLISGEIHDDGFFTIIIRIAAIGDVWNSLEIGSSSGTGSTQAFVEAIRSRPDKSALSLFCIELNKERFIKLKETYAADLFVKAYNVSSIASIEFPSLIEVILFFIRHNSRIRSK